MRLVVCLAMVAYPGIARAAENPSRSGTLAGPGALAFQSDPMLAPPPPAPVLLQSWNEVIAHLRSRSVDLQRAYAEIRQAEGRYWVAAGGVLPGLAGQVIATRQLLTKNTTTPAPKVATAGVVLTVPLVASQAWANLASADSDVEAAKLSADEVRRRILGSVAGALLAVSSAERIAELNRVGLRMSLDRVELVVRQRSLGAANNTDVLRAEQDSHNARATLLAGDESLRQSRETLGLMLGLSEQVGIAAGLDPLTLEDMAARSCQAKGSLEDRSDVAAARLRLRAGERYVTSAGLSFLPTLALQSSLGYTTLQDPLMPQTTWQLQGVLSIPLWDGGGHLGGLRLAQGQRDALLQDLESVRRGATVDAAQAKRGLEISAELRTIAEHGRDTALDVERHVHDAYSQGRGTSLELVLAAAQLRESEINLVLRQFEAVKARVAARLSLASCIF